MRYEWDEAKNLRNQRKHGGIPFEVAALVFEDERCLIGLDRVDRTGEQRWHAIGTARIAQEHAVLLVVHTYREDTYGEEIVRIISARRAEKREIRRYQEQAMD
ncbi:MAG TPA: BrnT family toxin [Terriglobia bacterium]|nr:BrnT family toxin [Terriglobia bacterium]